jgi:hypothetical protein
LDVAIAADQRPSLPSLQRIQHSHDRVTVFVEVLLRDLNVHFRPMFLQAKIRVFFKPPWGDLAFANTT